MLLAPALEGSVQVILDCSGVGRRGTAEGIQINHEEKLPLSSIQPLPPTALHHCWCQTVNLQAQHFAKPLEHQLSLSHATSAPQKKPAEPPGVSPSSCPSQGNFSPVISFRPIPASAPRSMMLEALQQPPGSGAAAAGALKCAVCLAREATFSWGR